MQEVMPAYFQLKYAGIVNKLLIVFDSKFYKNSVSNGKLEDCGMGLCM